MDEIKGFGVALLVAVLAILMIYGIVALVAAPISYWQCEQMTAEIGYDHKWSFFGGCVIETAPDHWIPLDNYREFGEQ